MARLNLSSKQLGDGTLATENDRRLSVAVLISGGGSNLQAFIDASQLTDPAYEIALVMSNQAQAGGLTRAQNASLPTECIDHRDFPTREAFDAEMLEVLAGYQPDVIVLAGFMRILTPLFIARYVGRIFNIHPSLLPKFPGLDTHQRAIDAGEEWHGATVHFATEQLDGGPPIIQGRVPVLADDTSASLAARVLHIEHQIYPYAVRLFAEGRLSFAADDAWLDGQRLDAPLQFHRVSE